MFDGVDKQKALIYGASALTTAVFSYFIYTKLRSSDSEKEEE